MGNNSWTNVLDLLMRPFPTTIFQENSVTTNEYNEGVAMKNKLSGFIAIIYVFFFALPFLPALFTAFTEYQMNPFDYARITDVDYRAVVLDEPGSEGSVLITERLTFDIHAASRSNTFWELWRDLPEDYVDGVKVDYKVHSVKQILEDGTEIIYEESDRLYWEDEDYVRTNTKYGPGKWFHSPGPYNENFRDYECVFFYIDDVYRETMVFEVTYEMRNAALKYNDCSDLYLALYSEDTINHLKSYHGEILFPEKDMPSEGNYWVTTYGTNADSFPVQESATMYPGYYTFYFDLDEDDLKFRPYNEYIEFDLVAYGDDKHIFTEYAPNNDYTVDDVLVEIREEQKDYQNVAKQYAAKKLILLGILLAVGIVVVFYASRLNKRMHNKHIFYDVEPLDFYRDIPSDLDPNFAAHFAFCKHKEPKNEGIYSAILLSLARKEYISLEERGSDDVEITILRNPQSVSKPVTTAASAYGTPISGNPYDTPGYGVSTFKQESANEDLVSNTITVLDNIQTIIPESDDLTQPLRDTLNDLGAYPYTTSENGYTTEGMASAEVSPTENAASETVGAVETPVQENPYEPLTPCEEYYYNLLVRHAISNSITLKYLQTRVTSDYENTDDFVRDIENSIVNIGIQKEYFQKADYKQPRKVTEFTAKSFMITGIIIAILPSLISYNTRYDLAFGGYFILGLAFLLSGLFMHKQASKYVLLTYEGEQEYVKWRGLYNFLNSETLIHERDYVELPLWEKYLVYATAFGLSEKIIKAISLRCPEVEDSPVLSNGCYRSRSFHHHSGRSFHRSVRNGSSIARSGGGGYGGGGFGYGGGGRGGGGGGGGH